MPDTCASCGAQLQLDERYCSVCQEDGGFPNVRYAERQEELDALADRIAVAEEAASAKGALPDLLQFADAVGSSSAVFNRWIGPLHTWIQGDNPLFQNFYHSVEQGRPFREDRFNRQRPSAEMTVNPWFYGDLSIAALTLDGTGLSYYGHFAVMLKDAVIEKRSTVFEENPFYFLERHHVGAGTDPPPGFRATWDRRGELAKAKLHSKIHKDTSAAEYASVLMAPERTSADCDFVEVHIYQDIHREAIKRVVGPVPADEHDAELWNAVRRTLIKAGCEVVEV